MSDETIERLEAWKGGHKARAVSISIDNGYGAACWSVTLHCEKLPGGYTQIDAAETAFWGGDCPPNVAFVADSNDEDFDWPGLAKTINAALDRFEQLRTAT